MKFLFVIPPSMGRYWKPSTPHVGIGYLSEVLLKRQHDTKTVDLRLHPDILNLYEIISSFKPDYIGLTTASLHYKEVYSLIDQIKNKYPDITCIIGGPHASVVKEEILQFSKADLVVYGEGEETILEIAKKTPYQKILGLIYRKNGEIHINPPRPPIGKVDVLPFPTYQDVDLTCYTEHKIPLYTERGCPMECSFCVSRLILGRGFRGRSPLNVINEISYWYKRGYKDFCINDDEFTGNMKRAENICDLLIDSNIQASFELRTGIRVDMINENLLKKMKKAGFKFYAFGIESGDQKVLNLAKKHITIRQVKSALKLINENGLKASGFFMIGLPGETYERFLKSIKLAEQLDLDEVRFYNTIPFPGTELYSWIEKNGRFLYPPEEYLNSVERWESRPVFETDDFTAEERIRAYNIGEHLFASHLLTKYLGKKLSKPFIYASQNVFFRNIIIKAGFRFTKFIRRPGK